MFGAGFAFVRAAAFAVVWIGYLLRGIAVATVIKVSTVEGLTAVASASYAIGSTTLGWLVGTTQLGFVTRLLCLPVASELANFAREYTTTDSVANHGLEKVEDAARTLRGLGFSALGSVAGHLLRRWREQLVDTAQLLVAVVLLGWLVLQLLGMAHYGLLLVWWWFAPMVGGRPPQPNMLTKLLIIIGGCGYYGGKWLLAFVCTPFTVLDAEAMITGIFDRFGVGAPAPTAQGRHRAPSVKLTAALNTRLEEFHDGLVAQRAIVATERTAARVDTAGTLARAAWATRLHDCASDDVVFTVTGGSSYRNLLASGQLQLNVEDLAADEDTPVRYKLLQPELGALSSAEHELLPIDFGLLTFVYDNVDTVSGRRWVDIVQAAEPAAAAAPAAAATPAAAVAS